MTRWPATLLLGAALGVVIAPSPARAEAVRVHIADGILVGVSDQGIASFKGVPYAAPPVGDLRWRPPNAPLHWSGARPAQDFGPSCMQPMAPRRVPPGSAAAGTSEDCLTLNIWTPVARTGSLPVMVWVHGGGNVQGSGAGRFYDGSAFAGDGVVLVTINYRLGVFGFFAHPALTHAAGGEYLANYALLDQIAALQWVQRNIAAFGGDPHNVTVFGESAGAQDILALLSTSVATRVLHKAIVESAGIWDDWQPLAAAEADGARFAAQLGLPGERATPAALRAVPAQQLMMSGDIPNAGPVIDGRLLRDAAKKALAHYPKVPLIIGSNGNEGSLLGADPKPSDALPGATAAELAALRAQYGAEGRDDGAFARALFRDMHFAAPARWIAASPRGAPSFLYRFDYVLSLLRSRRSGADHGSEVPYVFASWDTDLLSDSDRRVTDTLHGCWVAFAKTGTPSCAAVPHWPAYSSATDELVEFGEQAAVRTSNAPVLNALQGRFLNSQ
jgi:para-nitrobenzyl esterase